MKKAVASKTTTGSKNNREPAIDGWTIGLQFLDTTWRVALPIILLSYLGIYLDRRLGTRPLLALIGFFLALLVSTSLIFVQIKSAYPDFFRKPKKSNKRNDV